jgi:hypothetical protein
MEKLTLFFIPGGMIFGIFVPYGLGYGPATMLIGGIACGFLGMLAYLVVSRLE